MLIVAHQIADVWMRVITGERGFIGLEGDTVRTDILNNQVEHAGRWIDAAEAQGSDGGIVVVGIQSRDVEGLDRIATGAREKECSGAGIGLDHVVKTREAVATGVGDVCEADGLIRFAGMVDRRRTP